jgi:hypothetical protein
MPSRRIVAWLPAPLKIVADKVAAIRGHGDGWTVLQEALDDYGAAGCPPLPELAAAITEAAAREGCNPVCTAVFVWWCNCQAATLAEVYTPAQQAAALQGALPVLDEMLASMVVDDKGRDSGPQKGSTP